MQLNRTVVGDARAVLKRMMKASEIPRLSKDVSLALANFF